MHDKNIEPLGKNAERLDKNIERLGKGLGEQKRKAREDAQEMSRIAGRIGRFAEDIVAPKFPRIARESFAIDQFDFSGQRVEKRQSSAPSKLRAFDGVLAGEKKPLITKVKSPARPKYIEEFTGVIQEIFEFFTDYRGFSLIPIFARLGLSPDFTRRLTRLKFFARAMNDRTMEWVNFQELSTWRNGTKGGLQ